MPGLRPLFLLCLSVTIFASAAFGQSFELTIPRGPTWEGFYRNAPDCQYLIKNDPLSIFGIEASQKGADTPGLTVTNVASGGPASGKVAVGDLLISMNGVPFLETQGRLRDSEEKIWEGYAFSRGIYLFGFRKNQPVEFLVHPCGHLGGTAPAAIPEYFKDLYTDAARLSDARLAILIAGFTRGKVAGHPPSSPSTNSYQVFGKNCWVKAFTEANVTQTEGQLTPSGRLLNKRESGYSYSIDVALFSNVQRNFDDTQNNKRVLTRSAEIAIARLVGTIGCANPEWKGLERKLYQAVGKSWSGATTRRIDWNALGIAPPQ